MRAEQLPERGEGAKQCADVCLYCVASDSLQRDKFSLNIKLPAPCFSTKFQKSSNVKIILATVLLTKTFKTISN